MVGVACLVAVPATACSAVAQVGVVPLLAYSFVTCSSTALGPEEKPPVSEHLCWDSSARLCLGAALEEIFYLCRVRKMVLRRWRSLGALNAGKVLGPIGFAQRLACEVPETEPSAVWMYETMARVLLLQMAIVVAQSQSD